MKSSFSLIDWQNVSSSIKLQKGVYKIIAQNKRYIPRLTGKDYDCILYIGSSANLKRRLSFLYSSIIKKRKSSHSVSKIFNNTKIEKNIPLKYLMIDITYEDNYVDKEDDLIKKYMLKYSELPPLNHKFIRQ